MLHRRFENDRQAIAAAVLTALTSSLGLQAQAEIILDQPDTELPGFASQEFPDIAGYTCAVFDDFTLTETYDLTALVVYGQNSVGGAESYDLDVRLRIWTEANLGGVALATVSGTDIGGALHWDLTGITLGAGTYWISAQVVRPYKPGGQWYWRDSATTNGAHAMWHNPGGAFGFGTDPISTAVLGSEYHDMAMTLEGVVPAPGAALLLAGGWVSGLAGGFTRRERTSPRAR